MDKAKLISTLEEVVTKVKIGGKEGNINTCHIRITDKRTDVDIS